MSNPDKGLSPELVEKVARKALGEWPASEEAWLGVVEAVLSAALPILREQVCKGMLFDLPYRALEAGKAMDHENEKYIRTELEKGNLTLRSANVKRVFDAMVSAYAREHGLDLDGER